MLDAIIDELIKDSLRKAAAGGDLRAQAIYYQRLRSQLGLEDAALVDRGILPRGDAEAILIELVTKLDARADPPAITPCPSSSRRRRPASRKSIALPPPQADPE